jgi:hypothetical protein
MNRTDLFLYLLLILLDIIVRYPQAKGSIQIVSDFFSFKNANTDPAISIVYIHKSKERVVEVTIDKPQVTPNAAATIQLYV